MEGHWGQKVFIEYGIIFKYIELQHQNPNSGLSK